MHLMGAPALTHKAEAELPAANSAAPPKANVMMAIEGANVGECEPTSLMPPRLFLVGGEAAWIAYSFHASHRLLHPPAHPLVRSLAVRNRPLHLFEPATAPCTTSTVSLGTLPPARTTRALPHS